MPNRTIYINKKNDERLVAWSKSPSNLVGSLINKLLDEFFDVPEKNTPVATQHTPKSENGFYKLTQQPQVFNRLNVEQPCCEKPKTCKHWVWDSDRAIFINTLSGREREADI